MKNMDKVQAQLFNQLQILYENISDFPERAWS